MNPDQIDKQLSWLDEQRRKDAEQVGGLERQIASAVEAINSHENQLKLLSSEITRLSALTTQIRQFDETLGKQRDSFAQKLTDSEQLFLEKQAYQEDLRKHDYEELSKSVAEIKVDLRETNKMMDVLDARKQEEIRIIRKMDELQEKVDRLTTVIEEQGRNVGVVDEARKLDSKRIVDLQSDSTDLRVKIDSQRGAQDSVEDRVRRIEGNLDTVASTLESRQEVYTLWEEKQEMKMVEFEKKWKEWHIEFDDFQQKAKDVEERIIKYDENYRLLSQTRVDLDKVIEKLERRISEISEMQRFNEERLKQEWTNYQADDQKRWNTYKLTNDELWRDHVRTHEKISQDLQLMSEHLNDNLLAIEEISESSQQRVMDLFSTISQWAEAIDKKVSEIR